MRGKKAGKVQVALVLGGGGGNPVAQRMDIELVSCGAEKRKPAGFPESTWIRSILLETSGYSQCT